MKAIRHRNRHDDAELDITAFMNLMIVLVPVLLMSMVFSHVSIIDLKLPDSSAAQNNQDKPEKKQLELIIRKDYLDINYPAGIRLKRVAQQEGVHDYKTLSAVLQEIKRQLKEKGIDKRDITILSERDTSYQAVVSTMDTARSFQAVLAAGVVNAELFPQISLGDAPTLNSSKPVGGGQ